MTSLPWCALAASVAAVLAAGLAFTPVSALAQAAALLSPIASAGDADPASARSWPPLPWAIAQLPAQTLPATRYQPVSLDGQPALRIEANGSYGNLVHPSSGTPGQAVLSWRWRIDALNSAADLRRREGDDTSLKVCVLFDMPIERVPFVERQLLRIARSRTAQPLPAASVCYVWDARLPVGSRIDNAYSRRVRYLVLRSPPAPMRQWVSERRDLAADFQLLFGDESPREVPALLAVAIGADADNTGGRSLAYLTDLSLVAAP